VTTSVLLTSEGTYPHYQGGVSVWCDQLIRQASGSQFDLFSIIHTPRQRLAFSLPENVRSMDSLSLWGTEEAGCLPLPFSEVYHRRLSTTPAAIAAGFLPLFRVVVRSVFEGPQSDPASLGEAFHALQLYFEKHDYSTTLTSQLAWECFKEIARRQPDFTLDEATTCMRWLVRYLAITARPFVQPSIVHASMAGMAAVPGVLLKLRFGTPFLLTEHGIYLRELYVSLSKMQMTAACRRFLLGWSQAIVRMNYYYADHITCLGEFNRKWQLRFGADLSKIEFVPNGVSARKFFPDPHRRPARLTVLTLARIFPLKGIDNLVRAIAIVHKQAPHIRFRILGEVADKEYFAECLHLVAENQIQDVIEWGVTKEPENEMRAAHVYCLPSVSEGLPYTLLEAMFSGLPVVSTNVGNVAETLGGTGLLVPPGRPDELAHALLTMLDRPGGAELRDRLAEAALERGRRHYTLEKAMRPFLTRYEVMSRCETSCQIV